MHGTNSEDPGRTSVRRVPPKKGITAATVLYCTVLYCTAVCECRTVRRIRDQTFWRFSKYCSRRTCHLANSIALEASRRPIARMRDCHGAGGHNDCPHTRSAVIQRHHTIDSNSTLATVVYCTVLQYVPVPVEDNSTTILLDSTLDATSSTQLYCTSS
jgi:hypothetical protein